MSQEPSDSSEALERLKKSSASPDVPISSNGNSADDAFADASSENSGHTPDTSSGQTQQAAALQPRSTPHQAEQSEDKMTLRDKFNAWLDSFRGPTQEDIERAIANTPDRIQARWQKIQDERQAAREAEERARRLAYEVEEAKRALESQWEREAEKMAELERQQAAEARRRQQERETEALLQAAREVESDDVPAPENRPMMQREGEYLSDEELLELARIKLPEWQRLERIVNKARSIEEQTPPPPQDAAPVEEETDEEVVLPFRKPVTDDPEPEHLDGFRRITLSISWVLFVLVGLFALGWMGPWPSVLDANDGVYAGSTTLMSMASWHIVAWPLLWFLMLLYTLYQWSSSQYSAVRNRATAWYVLNAMLLASGTLLLVHFQDWGLEVLTSAAAAFLLIRAVRNLNLYTERTVRERYLVDQPIGIFTGWMLIFTATSLFTAMASWNVLNFLFIPEIVWAIAALLVLLVMLSRLTLTGRGRLSIAVGFGFGAAAIIGSRLFGQNQSFLLTVIAVLGLFSIFAATENRRYQIASAEKRVMEHLVYLDDIEDDGTERI